MGKLASSTVCDSGVSGLRVLIVDQWIETGGTMKAAIKLVEKLGATVVGEDVFFFFY